MTTLTDSLHRHHRHCDEMFAAAEAAVAAADWGRARVSGAAFGEALETHFRSEEELLFPAFEAETGMTIGPTQKMRLEHAQMRSLVEQLRTALAEQQADKYAGAAETLLILMQQHNIKEENILYPMCDRTLAAQTDTLGAALCDRLDAECRPTGVTK